MVKKDTIYNNLKKKYSYIKFKDSYFKEIFNKIYDYAQRKCSDFDDNLFEDFLYNLFEKQINKIILDDVDSNQNLRIINDYIDKIILDDNVEDKLVILTTYFDKFEYNFNYTELLKNNISFYDLIEENKDRKLNSESFKNIMEAYYKINEFSNKKIISEDNKNLTEEERHLFNEIYLGNIKAKDTLILKNLNLVKSIANYYTSSGMEFDDLYQDGIFGLIKAIEKFDVDKNCKFSTYATWWIRQTITKAIFDKSRLIRLPAHINSIINKLNVTRNKLILELNHEPTDEEIAKEMNITVNKVKEITMLSYKPLSFDTPLGEEDFYLDKFIDYSGESIENLIVRKLLIEEYIYKIKKIVTKKQAQILILRYGLEDGKFKTLEEVGKILGISRKSVSQSEKQAFKQLKRSPFFNELNKNTTHQSSKEENRKCRINHEKSNTENVIMPLMPLDFEQKFIKIGYGRNECIEKEKTKKIDFKKN